MAYILIMELQETDEIKQQRGKDLVMVARAIYESAVHEEDKKRLELHRHLAVEAAALIDEAIEKDGILHPDLGLELLLFIELKEDGNSEAEPYRKQVLSLLEDLEKVYRPGQ